MTIILFITVAIFLFNFPKAFDILLIIGLCMLISNVSFADDFVSDNPDTNVCVSSRSYDVTDQTLGREDAEYATIISEENKKIAEECQVEAAVRMLTENE